ncbi:probable methyltransferase TARBP1 isoform X2 [Dunckerocampus dactyliophorus]|uniref:probable methyltransferase TARBP1 isoform X2 n=1 Tax=Dunckerocampus dactyliophorus TaxID=161453 RepID=UPI002405FB8A|nr:probable methyltransferase TARBP1 isoform X2 [Dunckerocampus dactyliophorus]
MNSVLMNAVLSASPNYELLFESLCWPADVWPETARVEALTAFLEGLKDIFLQSECSLLTPAKRQCLLEKTESVIWTHCLPLLSRISAEAEGLRCRSSIAALCGLVAVCVRLCDPAVAVRATQAVLPLLQLSEEELPGVERLSVEIASDVISALLPSLTADDHLTSSILSCAFSGLRTLPDGLLPRVTIRLLLALLGCCSDAGLSSLLQKILNELCTWHSSERTPAVTERTLLCLTALSDHLLAPAEPDPRPYLWLWLVVQDGLIHRDYVVRKRALYLLKRCVASSQEQGVDCPLSQETGEEVLFKWTPKSSKLLREFWEDYVLVMETLEENQVHVVRPVLNRIDTLVQTTAKEGQDLFHPSWLLCVYQRMFHSENKTLMRAGVCHFLELQVLQQPAFALAFSQFIVCPFMDILSEMSLYCKAPGQSVGECPELAIKLQIFLKNFFSSLPAGDRGCVLLQMIQRLGCKHWCAVPLFFISQALSKLAPNPILGIDGLIALREVLCCTMITHQVLLRGAAQCFLLKSALCLIDVRMVTLDDVFSFLANFRADESLCRGTDLWNEVCIWLSSNEGSFKPMPIVSDSAVSSKDTVKAYIQGRIHDFLRVPACTGQTEGLPDPKEADKLARSILLCADMERIQPGADIADNLQLLLSPLLETLSRVSTNIYLPLRKSDKSLQLVLRLLQLRGTPKECVDDVTAALKRLIFQHADPIQEFIMRRLCGEMQELFDVERAELYLCVLKQHAIHSSKFQQASFPKLIKYSLSILQEPSQQIPSVASQVAKAIAMASLAMVCLLIEQQAIDMESDTFNLLKQLNEHFNKAAPSSWQSQSPLGCFSECLPKPHIAVSSSDEGGPGPLLQDWGRTAAQFMRDQWICFSFLIKTVGILPELHINKGTLAAALSCSVEALALLPSDLVLPVLAFMETVLPQLVQEEEALCVEALSQSWELVHGLSTNAHDFWPALKGFISLAFHQRLLLLTDRQAPALTVAVKQIATDLMELSESKNGVFGVLLQHCCHTWLPTSDPDDDIFSSVLRHINILSEACIYGPVFRRDQRLVQDVQTYVEQLGEGCAANTVVVRDDQLPRMYALAFLSRLDPSNQLHERLMEQLVVTLLEKDKNMSKSVRISSNSLQHRVKNRVWQTLLLLLPKFKEEFVTSLLNSVFEAGFCSNQASVKYLIEWMMILILFHYPQHIDRFWVCFDMNHGGTKTGICTFLAVLVHFAVIIPKLKDPDVQLVKALDVTLQWCFHHNFSVRLYALLALKRVWSLVEVRGNEAADGLRGLSTVVKACLHQTEALKNTGNANKNWTRIQEHFFFGAFDPIRDYSIETIFYTFPSLSGLADDEWIPPWKLEKHSCVSQTPPLKNAAPDLSQLQPGDWIQQDKSEEDKEERWAEVQKKITPWRLDIQEQDPDLHLVPQQRVARVGKHHGALLVVASLIDKPTNLGGLCRTCEIFGASALALDNLRHISDKHFQSLSVSSELWLPLLEVKPLELADFLQVKKSQDYCIVGVEQTANSQSLQDYQFPEKTLLLLGNEREGIPANLLQLLDVCVEIPQQGVIRSLNVHVSAALLIWEYTRQHLTCTSS